MLSTLVAAPEAASVSADQPTRVVREIKDRITLCRGYTVMVYVPEDAALGCYPPEKPEIYFVRFPLPMSGGVINCFVHGKNADDVQKHCGKTISAECEIVQKTFTDGVSYLHIDFVPTRARVVVKHQVTVINGHNHRHLRDSRKIETPKPVKATVFITPFGVEFLSPGRFYLLHERRDKVFTQPDSTTLKTDESITPERPAMPRKTERVREILVTERSLDDLKAQGWQLFKYEGRTAFVYATIKGHRQEMKTVSKERADERKQHRSDQNDQRPHQSKR